MIIYLIDQSTSKESAQTERYHELRPCSPTPLFVLVVEQMQSSALELAINSKTLDRSEAVFHHRYLTVLSKSVLKCATRHWPLTRA